MAGEISSVNGNRPIDIWIPVPVRMNQAAWSQYLTDVYNNHPSGKVKIEAGNEIWNTMYPFNLQVDWYNQIYIRGAENGGDNIQRPVYTASGVVYPTPYNVNGSLGSYTYSYTTTGSTSSVDHLRMYSTGTNAEGGITISLPASTEQRTAKLYIMGYGSTVDSLSMSLVCTMSDSSASQTVNYTLVNQGNDNYLVVDLTYRAGSAGQTLNAYWRMNGYSGVSAVRAVHFGAAWVSNPGTTGAAAISATITATGGNVDITALGGADYLISRNGQTIANGFRKTGGGSTISVVEVDTTDAYTVDHEDKAPRAYSATDSTPSMSSNTATIPSWEIAQCMMAHQAVDRWVTAETIYGRSRVLRTICGQSTNQGFAAYSLLTQTSKLGTTDTVAKKMDVFAVGNYIKMGVASTTNECRTDSLVAEKFNENVNAHQEYYNRLKIYIDNVLVPSHTSSMSDLAAKGATQASLMAYECWRHTNTLILQDAYGTLGQFTVNTSDNTLTYVPDTAGLFSAYSIITRDEIFENGDVIRFNVITHIPTGTASYSSGALLIPLTQFPGEYLVDGQLYVRRVSTDKISLHRTYTDAINNTNIITLQATVDAVKGANITRIKAIEDIQRNFAKSELGRKIFIYWWNVCVRPFFKEVNLYTQAGRWNDGFGTTWGLVENSFVSDHVAAVQARKVNNIGVTCSDLLSS
jgi:hypothetical protein